ncbi:MAG TPA: CDP-alcohol phosphatidyltransferase family protein [Thermoanaerobaculia bacterium]|nr:CDP-alcohol phosphatidyltransferase family protein [Thermoanaerobaculia bacterium]
MTFTIPNLLSLLRMGLIPFFIIAVTDGNIRRALILFVIAGVTDALDGAIARFFNQKSLLGTYLDPVADKMLLMSAYVALAIPTLNHGALIPLWVTVLVITRDILLVTVALLLYLAVGIKTFPPTLLSKMNTLVQVVTAFIVLASGVWTHLDGIATVLLYLVAALTVASGLDYVYRMNRRIGEQRERTAEPEPPAS